MKPITKRKITKFLYRLTPPLIHSINKGSVTFKKRAGKRFWHLFTIPKSKTEWRFGKVDGEIYAWGFLCCFHLCNGKWNQLTRLPGLQWCPYCPSSAITLEFRNLPRGRKLKSIVILLGNN